MTACLCANRVLEDTGIIVKSVRVYSWSDIIKTAVDDLKKSGAPKNVPSPPISTPPGPFTYDRSKFVYLCLPMFSDTLRHLSAGVPFRHNSTLSSAENGSLENDCGETASA